MSYVRSNRYPELFRKRETGPWWVFLPNREGGKQPRESTGLKDERAAHEWYLERIQLPSTAKQATASKERTIETALVSRLDWLKASRLHDDPSRKKKALATIEFYRKKGRALVRELGGQTLLSAIGHEQIRKYIVARSATAGGSTIAKELTTLSCAMRLARKDGVSCPVFKDIVPEDFEALYIPRTRWLSEAEVNALLDVLAPKRAAVVAFIVATSASYPSEVAPVRPEHVKGYDVHIPGKKTRTRDRRLRVPSHARKYLDRALEHLGPSGFEQWTNVRKDLHAAAELLSMCKKCRAARQAWSRHEVGATKQTKGECLACSVATPFVKLSPNDLRRTFVQWLVRSGVPYELVYPMAGHNSPRMLETVYGKRDARAVADLVELALKKAPKGARGAKRTG